MTKTSQSASVWLPVKKLFLLYLGFIAIFFLGRLGLFVLYYDRIVHSGTEYWWSFLYGLRMDTIVASLFLLIPAILLLLVPSALGKFAAWLSRAYLLFLFLLVIYIENATFPFFAEFDVRPNALFINYLEYPKEVLGNIWASYKPQIFISTLMLIAFGIWFWRKTQGFFIEVYKIAYWKRAALFLPVFIILFIGVRSSFKHRPANISDATYTNSHLVNKQYLGHP